MASNFIEGLGKVAENITSSRNIPTASSKISFPLEYKNQPSTALHITKNNIDTSSSLQGGYNVDSSSYLNKLNINPELKSALSTVTESIDRNSNALLSPISAVTGANIKSQDIYNLILPMPNEVSVSYTAEWEGKSLTPLEYALREIIQGKFSQESMTNASDLFLQRSAVGILQNVVGRNKISSVGNGIGIAFNPYRELLYDAPSFRTFDFEWNLSPKNAQESDAIRKIVFYLKKHMHPSTFGEGADDSLIFLYPELCTLEFLMGDNNANPYLFKLEECAITNVNVFYDNKFHQGTNAPTQVSLSISLMETKILTQKDFGDNPDALTY